jgi:hypothetical protein
MEGKALLGLRELADQAGKGEIDGKIDYGDKAVEDKDMGAGNYRIF